MSRTIQSPAPPPAIRANAAAQSIITLAAPCQIQAAAGNSNRGAFEAVAYTGKTMKLAGWDMPVVIDLDGLDTRESVPVLADHRPGLMDRLGEAKVAISDGRVVATGRIVPGTPEADRALAFGASGMPISVSIGAVPLRVERVPSGSTVVVNGHTFTGPIDLVREARVDELSVVGVGADEGAYAQVAAQRAHPSPYSASHADPATIAAVERQRVQAIHAVFAGINHPHASQTRDLLINQGASVDAANQEANALLRASRPAAPGVRGVARSQTDRQAVVAAMLCHGGASDVAARHFKPEVVEQGASLSVRAGSTLNLMREMLAIHGMPQPESHEDLIRASFGGGSSFSTDALSGLFQEVISIVALDAFTNSEEPWRQFAHRTPLADFKENTLTRLAGSFRYQPVGQTGELVHSTLDSETTKIRLGTHGTILGVSRETIINDSATQLLAQVSGELAAEASRVVGDHFVELLRDEEGEFFTVERKNLLIGSDSRLSIESLLFAVACLRKQRDKSGRTLNLSPAYLLVGAELEGRARAILNSTEVVGPSTDATPSGNPAHAIAEPLVDARLGDDEWYLLAAPRNAGAVVGLLNGRDRPTIESMEMGPSVLGKTWRGYFDFGVALHEWRAIVKSTGAAS